MAVARPAQEDGRRDERAQDIGVAERADRGRQGDPARADTGGVQTGPAAVHRQRRGPGPVAAQNGQHAPVVARRPVPGVRRPQRAGGRARAGQGVHQLGRAAGRRADAAAPAPGTVRGVPAARPGRARPQGRAGVRAVRRGPGEAARPERSRETRVEVPQGLRYTER